MLEDKKEITITDANVSLTSVVGIHTDNLYTTLTYTHPK